MILVLDVLLHLGENFDSPSIQLIESNEIHKLRSNNTKIRFNSNSIKQKNHNILEFLRGKHNQIHIAELLSTDF